MANLSQLKRQRMLEFLQKVRDKNNVPVHLSYTYFVADRVVFTSESVS